MNVWILAAVIVFAVNGVLHLVGSTWEPQFLLSLGLALFAFGHIHTRSVQ